MNSKPNQMTNPGPILLHITHSTPMSSKGPASNQWSSVLTCLCHEMTKNMHKMNFQFRKFISNQKCKQWLWDFLYKFLMPWIFVMQKIKSKMMQMHVNKNAPIQCQKCDTNCHIFLHVSKMIVTCEKNSKSVINNSCHVWM